MSSNERLYYLFNQYIGGAATVEEVDELKSLLNLPSYEETVRSHLEELLLQTTPLPEHSEVRWHAIMKQMREPELPAHSEFPDVALASRQSPFVRRWWAIAAALVGVAIGGWLLFRARPAEPAAVHPAPQQDRAPGGNVATLTLANGQRITLDSAHNGQLTQQGNTQITKLKDGRLAYKVVDQDPAISGTNTLSTPRGGQYRLTLPDGSEVWLNAASSITYPTAFAGPERKVSVSGEAYFEIAPDAHHPFMVAVQSARSTETIQVLGTSFNVNAYGDEESLATTLLSGSVRLVSGDNRMLLKPGEQGLLQADGKMRLDPNANVEEVVAWKNGLFHFENADINEVMRQIARWYDVEVVMDGKMPSTEKFDGEISRSSNLTEVLKILQLSNIHFSIEGKKVTVKP